MKTKYLISFIIISLALVGSVAWAQNIQYPVKELGSCQDESACKSYCDKSENAESCVNFAEKNNLMSKEEIGLAKKFMAMGSKGPGGCKGKNECDAYCNEMANIDECVAFAEKNNLMSTKELEEAKKVQAAIKRGVKPPPCNGKKACDTYCEDPNHMEECITFGAEAGFIQGKELEDAQKMLAAIKKGVKLLPCKGKEACDAYCNDSNNMETCMNFAMEVGFMNEQEKADSQKMLKALKKGVKPPNCRGKDECDAYCAEDAHIDECINFSIAAGFMTEKDAEMAKKTGGKGPGDCKGKDECDAFCNNPDNQETCFNFAKENGMISETDLKQMGEGKQKFQESLQQAPSVVLDCLNSEVGTNMMDKFKGGAAVPPKDIGDKMRTCYEKMRPSGSEGQGEKFQPAPGAVNPGGQTMPQQAGPGGCKGPEECKVYCESHQEECQKFQPMQGQSGQGQSGQMQPQNQQGQNQQGQNQQGQPGQPGQNQPGPKTNSQQMMPQEGGTGTGPNMQPPSNQQPPANQQPPTNMQPPMNNIAPPPPSEAPIPPPSSSITPESSLGSLLNIFLFMFKQ